LRQACPWCQRQAHPHGCHLPDLQCFFSKSRRQLYLQADNEPICIDSDEDDHAVGSAPARENDQNGAGPELRRSERTNLNQSTTVKFKVPAATVTAHDCQDCMVAEHTAICFFCTQYTDAPLLLAFTCHCSRQACTTQPKSCGYSGGVSLLH